MLIILHSWLSDTNSFYNFDLIILVIILHIISYTAYIYIYGNTLQKFNALFSKLYYLINIFFFILYACTFKYINKGLNVSHNEDLLCNYIVNITFVISFAFHFNWSNTFNFQFCVFQLYSLHEKIFPLSKKQLSPF